jgi:FKBP-type peptidyl-prolyl cis-trans isomerase (trigger factor)
LDFSTLNFTKKELALTEEEYQKQLDGILKIHGSWHVSTDSNYQAKLGDRVKVDFTVLNEDGSKSDAVEQSVEIALEDKNQYGFEQGVLGMCANESKIIDKFDVKVLSISSCTKAELNDELATKLGVHCSHDIRGYVEEKLQAYVEDVDLKSIRASLLNIFVEKYSDLPLPEKLLERYKAAMNKGEFNAANMGPAGISPDEQVRRAVVLDLLRARISKKFNLKINEERVIELITRLALSTFGNYDLVLDLYSKNPALLNQVRTLVLDEQITKLVLENAKLNIEKVSLAEIEKVDEEPLN